MSNYNILVVTHNSRLRNLIRILFPELSSIDLPRFKNCAILHLQIKKYEKSNIYYTFTLKLIYEGEIINEKGRKYFDYNNFHHTIPSNNYDLPFIITRKYDIINIFLVRHGEGEHNIVKGFAKLRDKDDNITDALLTPKGIRQAKNAGYHLFAYLNKINLDKIDYTFCSKLRRSYYTGTNILNVLSFDSSMIPPKSNQFKNITTAKNIIVLPCSHEINKSEQGVIPTFKNLFEMKENTSLCANKRNRINHNICPKEKEKHMVINNATYAVSKKSLQYYTINWDYYDKTFPSWYSSQTLKCTTNNNMIAYIIRYIDNPN